MSLSSLCADFLPSLLIPRDPHADSSRSQRGGLQVIGSAGSDDKVAFLKELGCFDVVFNYKTESTRDILEANPPDIYFDNVGGATLEAVLDTINKFGRIIACGALLSRLVVRPLLMALLLQVLSGESTPSLAAFLVADTGEIVSDYNVKPEDRYPIRNLFQIIGKELTFQGFIISGSCRPHLSRLFSHEFRCFQARTRRRSTTKFLKRSPTARSSQSISLFPPRSVLDF